jgi:formamidase
MNGTKDKVIVSTYTNGILDPNEPMLGPVRSGGIIEANTMPGCWGPMITPHLRGGHEVTRPVAVENAEVGDAIAIKIQEIKVTSAATASGVDRMIPGHFLGDPFVAKQCPGCGVLRPGTTVKGIGQESIRCANCGTPLTPFQFEHGYTVVFDDERTVGVTIDDSGAEKIARDARRYAQLSDNCSQHPILLFAPHDLVGAVSRMRPFMGQLGTTPAVRMPDSHNAGDFGVFLLGAPHEYALKEEQLEMRTDGHMDIDAVRQGAIVIAPVKARGGGIYLGDMHALQGDGEIAGHTMDVAGVITIRVEVIKNRPLHGPVLFPLVEDLPYLARPITADEKRRARALAKQWGIGRLEEVAPISVVGTGADLNKATETGLRRAAELLGMGIAEVRNRATITGAIEIGRLPGVVQITFLAPLENLAKADLLPYVKEQYGIG